MSKKILVVDDEKLIVKGIRFSLEQEGMEVTCAYDGEEALEAAKNTEFDIILLDIMLPKLTGLEVCQQIREFSNVPIIMLTAKSEDADKLLGFESGADDYITKPFAPDEVLARVRVVLRRRKKSAPEEALVCKNIAVYPELRRVEVCGQELTLTAIEFDLLLTLMRSPGKVFSRERLYEEVWKDGYYGTDHTVNVHVSNLRKKLKEADPDEEYIQSVYGIGFRLVKS